MMWNSELNEWPISEWEIEEVGKKQYCKEVTLRTEEERVIALHIAVPSRKRARHKNYI